MARSDPALWLRIVSVLLFFSFFWISYVSQTHIHGLPVTAATASTTVKSGQIYNYQAGHARGKHNTDDQDNCPLCQAVSHGGIAVVPILVALLVVQSVIQSVFSRLFDRPSINHFEYAHRTRGPPTL